MHGSARTSKRLLWWVLARPITAHTSDPAYASSSGSARGPVPMSLWWHGAAGCYLDGLPPAGGKSGQFSLFLWILSPNYWLRALIGSMPAELMGSACTSGRRLGLSLEEHATPRGKHATTLIVSARFVIAVCRSRTLPFEFPGSVLLTISGPRTILLPVHCLRAGKGGAAFLWRGRFIDAGFQSRFVPRQLFRFLWLFCRRCRKRCMMAPRGAAGSVACFRAFVPVFRAVTGGTGTTAGSGFRQGLAVRMH